MTTTPPSILLCTNGDEHTRPALDYGIWLAGLLKIPVTLLGVIEREQEGGAVDALLSQARLKLEAAGITYQVELDRGRGSLIIARYANSGSYYTVVGPLGRPVWRRVVQGRSFRRMLSRIETPLFYVRTEHLQIKRILACMGGLGYAQSLIQLCTHLAKISGARVTILHIVEPVSLQYRTSQAIDENWQTILETDTPQGSNLRSAVAWTKTAGVFDQFIVRRGSPVHEIIEAARQKEYDLIGLGSPYSAHSLRHLYLPNVTAEVAEASNLPVLTVRQDHALLPAEQELTKIYDTQHDR